MVTMENYEEYLLLYADGELGEAELKELEVFINQHPELKAEMDIYAATKLVPDEAIVYNGKEQLLKTAPTTRTISMKSWWIYGAAAACIGVLLMIGLNRQESAETNNIAGEVESQNSKVKTIATEEKKIDTAVSEELHSTPANSVAMETTKPQPTQQPLTQPKKAHYASHQAKQPKPTILPTPEKQVAKEEVAVVTKPEPAVTKPTETVERPIIPANEDVAVYTPEENEKPAKIIAMLTARKDKMQGLEVINDALNEKLSKAKELKNKMKDTDLHVRVGAKDLFVLRF